MRWPIRNQIFVPFAVVLLIAVSTLTVTAAWMAANNSERDILERLRGVTETLEVANFPFTPNVLTQLQGLTGAEFVALNQQGEVTASTLESPANLNALAETIPHVREHDSLGSYPSVTISNARYFAVQLSNPQRRGSSSLIVLYPERRWREALWQAAYPPLAIGGITLLMMLAVSGWLAHRLGRRIRSLRALFRRIAESDFTHAPVRSPQDELADLTTSANQLSDQLKSMRQTIQHTERIRLLAQLAGGLAHQLRNTATGARMAVQLHQRRCPRGQGDESLSVALRQLELSEEYVKQLLSLGEQKETQSLAAPLVRILHDVQQLVLPACRHAKVMFQEDVTIDPSIVIEDALSIRAAVLNVLLNAIEAAGIEGTVSLRGRSAGNVATIEISDNGPGPPEELADELFEPFVSSKAEGVGLGLTLAQRAARDAGGSLEWSRIHKQTTFTFQLPITEMENR